MIIMLIVAIESDESKAFMLNLYHDYYGLVRKTVYNITRDADNVKDLINDSFLNLKLKNWILENGVLPGPNYPSICRRLQQILQDS